jgi:hypothetical protein
MQTNQGSLANSGVKKRSVANRKAPFFDVNLFVFKSVAQAFEELEFSVHTFGIAIDDTIRNKLILGMNESYKKTLQTTFTPQDTKQETSPLFAIEPPTS